MNRNIIIASISIGIGIIDLMCGYLLMGAAVIVVALLLLLMEV